MNYNKKTKIKVISSPDRKIGKTTGNFDQIVDQIFGTRHGFFALDQDFFALDQEIHEK